MKIEILHRYTNAVLFACEKDTLKAAADLDWCLLHLSTGYRIFLVEFEAKDIAAIPIATDGKMRVKKLRVIEELDLRKYLPKKEEKPKESAA